MDPSSLCCSSKNNGMPSRYMYSSSDVALHILDTIVIDFFYSLLGTTLEAISLTLNCISCC